LIIRGAICPQIVRNADHRRVLNLRQLVNDALHLGGGDVLATRDYQVVLSVGQIEEAFGVEVADIARAEPIAEERGFRLLRVLPEALRDLGISSDEAAETTPPCPPAIAA
jgi:hypothetical protein